MIWIDAFNAAAKSFKAQWREEQHRRIATGAHIIQPLDSVHVENVRDDYLVTSDRGVFALQGGEMFRLFAADTFGLALRNGELFVATSSNRLSRVLKTRLDLPLRAGNRLQFREIHAAETTKSGRFHQIGFYENALAVCHTSANSIRLLDPETGAVRREIYPFYDQVGGKIDLDHNHINSISQCGETLLFCAYHAGVGALLGVIHESKLRGYRIQHVGAHDVHVVGRDIYYSDTFGSKDGSPTGECGYLVINNRRFDEKAFSTSTGYAVRGFARTGDEMLVGHSHKGSRRKRFEGSGALLRCVGGKVAEEIKMPFAQVYDIVGMSGQHFDEPPAVKTWNEVNELFASVFGRPIYEATV